MPNTEVTVAGVFPTKPGKKNGIVKGADGMLFQVPLSLLPMVKVSGVYSFSHKPNDFNGTTYNMVESVKEIAPPAPRAAPAAGNGKYSGNDPLMAERIFVHGMVVAELNRESTGFLNEDSATQLVNKWRNVWACTFGGQPAANPAPAKSQNDFDDEIPF